MDHSFFERNFRHFEPKCCLGEDISAQGAVGTATPSPGSYMSKLPIRIVSQVADYIGEGVANTLIDCKASSLGMGKNVVGERKIAAHFKHTYIRYILCVHTGMTMPNPSVE
jgi:hypothetical protein